MGAASYGMKTHVPCKTPHLQNISSEFNLQSCNCNAGGTYSLQMGMVAMMEVSYAIGSVQLR